MQAYKIFSLLPFKGYHTLGAIFAISEPISIVFFFVCLKCLIRNIFGTRKIKNQKQVARKIGKTSWTSYPYVHTLRAVPQLTEGRPKCYQLTLCISLDLFIPLSCGVDQPLAGVKQHTCSPGVCTKHNMVFIKNWKTICLHICQRLLPYEGSCFSCRDLHCSLNNTLGVALRTVSIIAPGHFIMFCWYKK